MESAEIRSRFLRYFEGKGHTIVPSASLLADDPTLLLVNAGMVPFKPYFLGEAAPPYQRATSVQKCVRTLDIDEVGKTTRHASFFQMCGNFSFGDYFKADAIPFAWELLTKSVSDGGFGFPEDRLWVTVYHDDDESVALWRDEVGVPEGRIQRRGMVDNFWSMGVPGPCGPCSEIYYDRGPQYGAEGGPVADEDRYLEIWNLVFMQFERGAGSGKEDYPIIGELPAKNIDTGMGLERMAAILQGVENIYEIDTTMLVLQRAAEISGRRYGAEHRDDVALRVVADHARTAAFLVADGVLPGNEGRGYVLRRMLRRTVRNMRLLGAHDPSIAELVATAIDAMVPQYPELESERVRILSVTGTEEELFLQTLRTGTTIFDVAAADVRRDGGALLSGEQAFALHDTYGFPIDLTLEMAAEQGLAVDEPGFRRLMAEQRDRAKADARSRKSGLADLSAYRELAAGGATEFFGYDEVTGEATLRGLLRDGAVHTSAVVGDDVEVVLDRTPFYAESGGQLGDHGQIRLDGAVIEIYDVQTPVPGLFVHRGSVISGEVVVGSSAVGAVDTERRLAISRAHTATHLIHKAFREALGETATQMGSENAPGRLRFDFPNPSAVPAGVLADVEARVNAVLLDDLVVRAEVMTQAQARDMGAMALFGEKYGDRVRVVSVGDWTSELCGGTHAGRSGQLGVVTFLSEGSIGAGVRRIEALVGTDAYRFLAREHLLVSQLAELVKVRPEELPERIEATLARLREAEREIAKIRTGALLADAESVIGEGRDIGPIRVWAIQAPPAMTAPELRALADRISGLTAPAASGRVFAAASIDGDKVSFVVATDSAARALGVSAQSVLQVAMPHVGGRGGGKEDVAQGGGGDISGVPAALAAVADAVSAVVGV
ncbi:MAG: alanine--tRNA ligase [Actinomycetes bacterium]